jgi:hypothetical protein
MMKIQKKLHMTLLETVIATTLLSILLTFVFGFFKELSVLSFLTEKAQAESFQMRYMEARLGFIFQRIVHEKKTAGKFFFYTQAPQSEITNMPSLIFTYDNEVRLDPHFSGEVLGRLYVDANRRLILATWPLHIPNPHAFIHQEILLENVSHLSFSCYCPPEPLTSTNQITTTAQNNPAQKTPERDEWTADWDLAYKQCPAIIKLTVKTADNSNDLAKTSSSNAQTQEHLFSFVLPSKINPIQYPPT